ncbi:MAG: hypothetical protein WBM14_04610 [Terracidiphilus sp.]|jgi:hypothetical protein
MKFDVKAMALTWAILWGGIVLLVAVANLIWSSYGESFLQMLASWYPGYHPTRSIGEVVVVTLYAIVDGLVGGAVFGWLYNRLVKTSA